MSRFNVIGRPRQRGVRRHPTFSQGGVAPPIIVALVSLVPLDIGIDSTPADMLPAGAALAASYASRAGAIVSVAVTYRTEAGPVAADYDLQGGERVSFEILVQDDQGNARPFRASRSVPAAPLPEQFFALIGGQGLMVAPSPAVPVTFVLRPEGVFMEAA